MQINFEVETGKKHEVVDLTEKVRGIISKSDIEDGICLVYVPHATCSIIVNENYDKAVCNDILKSLSKIIPEHDNYEHDKIDNNAAAHIRSAILSPSELIPIKNGILQLGKWQGIGLVEFDGPKKRKIYVHISES